MNKSKAAKRDLYYTNDHEWVDFQGTVAYAGVCEFKLKGIKAVQQITFTKNPAFKKQGEVIAAIQYDDWRILVHMPVDGKVISINDALLLGGQHLLLDQPEDNGWMALIVPSQPYERNGLLQPEQYKLHTKGKL